MGNKGQKSSNIFQKLKADGAWSSKDGSKPIIKDIGIKSPLNMKLNQSAGKHFLSTGSEGDKPANLKNSPLDLTGGLAVGSLVKKGVDKVKQAWSDYKEGKKTREEGEAKTAGENAAKAAEEKKWSDAVKKNKETGGGKTLNEYIKARDNAEKGSKEYAEAQNKINEAYGVSKRHEVKKEEENTPEVEEPKVEEPKPTAKEVAVKTDNVEEAKANVQTEREKKITAKADLAEAGGKGKKAERLRRRAARVAKRAEKGTGVGNLIRKGVAAVRGKKGAAKDAAIQSQVAANEAKANEESPAALNVAGVKAGVKAATKGAKAAARKAKKQAKADSKK